MSHVNIGGHSCGNFILFVNDTNCLFKILIFLYLVESNFYFQFFFHLFLLQNYLSSLGILCLKFLV